MKNEEERIQIYAAGYYLQLKTAFFPSIPLPTHLLILFITGIAIKMGTEESSDFTAEGQKGWVLRDAVVLYKRSRSRSYVQ